MHNFIQTQKRNLSQEKVNSGRQFAVDFARGLAVLFMIWVHVLEMFANTDA